MVQLYPVRTVRSTFADEAAPPSSPVNKIPNRFRSKIYDRSVFSGDDCVKAFGPCDCFSCHQFPVVVVSSGDSICDQYNITSRNIKEFLDGGLLEPLVDESFVIYGQERSDGKLQIGILAALDVEDCLHNIVKRHELCIPGAENTVSPKVKLYQSHYVDPIMIMYRQEEIVDDIISRIIASEEPISVDHKGSGGNHFIWAVRDKADVIAIQSAFQSVESLYIADGHHRTAAACQQALAPKPTRKTAQQPLPSSKYITALVFPDTQLNVLSFNRCLKSLPNIDEQQFLISVAERFEIEHLSETNIREHDEKGSADEIQMYYSGSWYQLTPREEVQDIDAQILVDNLFKPVLNMSYPESEKNMVYVDGRQGRQGVMNCVDDGKALVGFYVRRVQTRMIMQIADAGKLLPPKATFFDPKPMPGLLIRLKR